MWEDKAAKKPISWREEATLETMKRKDTSTFVRLNGLKNNHLDDMKALRITPKA